MNYLYLGIILLFVLYLVGRKYARPNPELRFFRLLKKEGIIYVSRVIFEKLGRFGFRILSKIFAPPELFRDRYILQDHAEIKLYLSSENKNVLFAKYHPQKSLSRINPDQYAVHVSLIATLRNEVGNVEAWARSVFTQTRLPDEIVITDAGSTDGTLEKLFDLAKESPIPFLVLSVPGVNIARGRNIAISHAQNKIIATSDLGCRLHPDWLEKIVTPFELDGNVQVAAGMYQAVDHQGDPVERWAWWSDKTILDPRAFLPSGRSSAFTKEIWETVGGYPEWLTLTGEDTYYAMELRRYSSSWAFVPEAIVDWQAPVTFLSYCKKIYYWSIGDGEIGLFGSSHWKLTLEILFSFFFTIFIILLDVSMIAFPWLTPPEVGIGISLAVWLLFASLLVWGSHIPLNRFLLEVGGMISKSLGFIKGAQTRGQADMRRHELIKGTFFILSGVPIDDTGGGARCTQIALELLRQKYAVVFINKFPKYESTELHLKIRDPNLFTYDLSDWDWDQFSQKQEWLLRKNIVSALVEMPLDGFVPLISKLKAHGGVVIYDLLDEWDTSLGGNWYSKEIETEIINSSQILIATVPKLVERLSQISQRKAHLLPNAVNTYLFKPDRFYMRPDDFPVSPCTAIYIGALWGDWFDWELLVNVAMKYPDTSVLVIGDYRGQCPAAVPNLHFLGLKPQQALPAYLAYSDVAIIPWKVNDITQATSPLKVYEYLAMHKPVIAPAITPLAGIPGVYQSKNNSDFVGLVDSGQRTNLPREEIDRFIALNNWQERIRCILELIHIEQRKAEDQIRE